MPSCQHAFAYLNLDLNTRPTPNPTSSTPAPVTPAPVTPAPVTDVPTTPAPNTPAPITPAPNTPAPITPAPITPAPITPAPNTPAPITPAPITDTSTTPAPITPAPVTPAPVTPAPNTPAPNTPAPITPAPVTPAPNTPAPITPAPITDAPTTPAPVTPAPVTPAPVTPSPTTSTTMQCGVNEVFTPCNGHCRPTCETGLNIVCTRICVPGCNCKYGYILDEQDGICIETNDCPRDTPAPITPAPITPSPTTVSTSNIYAINSGYLISRAKHLIVDMIHNRKYININRSINAYYFAITLKNIDDCAANIDKVQMYQRGEWVSADQSWLDSIGQTYSWNHRGIKFDTLLPVTIRIVFNNGNTVTLPELIETITPNDEFISDKTCSSIDVSEYTPAPVDIENYEVGIETCPGSNSWWYSAKVTDFPSTITITKVEMMDSSGNNDWIENSQYNEHNECWIFDQGNRPYELPLSFRITASDGQSTQTISQEDPVIVSYDSGSTGSMAQSFDSLSSASGFQADEEETDDNPGLIKIILIIVAAVSLIMIIIGITWYLRKRNNNKAYHNKDGAMDTITLGTNDSNITPVVDEESSSPEIAMATQTNIVAYEE